MNPFVRSRSSPAKPLALLPDAPEPFGDQPERPGPFWGKITGQAAGTNRYSFEEIDESDTAGFDVGLSAGFAQAGGTAANASPAYEINGLQTVPTGTRVKLWPAGDLSYYVFEYSAGASAGVGDVIGPDVARTGLLACFVDPSGRFIGPCSTLSFYEDTNVTAGTAFAQHRSRFAVTIPGNEGEDPYPALVAFRASRQPEWEVNTWVYRDAIDPTAGRTPTGATISVLHKSATQFISVGAWGSMDESVSRDYVYDNYAFAPGGGLCFYFRNYAFYSFSSVMAETVWYDSARGIPCKQISGQFWARHCSYVGTLGISAGSGGTYFEDGLFVQQGAAIAALAGGASLADTITKVNEISARLKTLGLIT